MQSRRDRFTVRLAIVTVTATVAAGLAAVAAAPADAVATAPGGPGAPSYFDLARKDCVGTSAGTTSKVWYTVADGVLSDVYEPTIDNTDVSTLQYVVTDGSTFSDLQTRDLSYTVNADATGMVCTVTATSAAHGYRLTTTYLTDPLRDSVLMQTQVSVVPGSGTNLASLHVYARLDAHANGDGGGGSQNAGANTGTLDHSTSAPVIGTTNTQTQAANRDYAVPTYLALRAARHGTSTVGYAGTASDPLTELDTAHALTRYPSAPNGHIVGALDVTPGATHLITLSLGFGRTAAGAVQTAGDSLGRTFSAARSQFTTGWQHYDAGLTSPPTSIPGLSASAVATAMGQYYLSANVIKASEDKTYPGAIVASLASPWGQSVPAGVLVGGKPVYFGSYREVFSRDLYEAFTGLLTDGDVATARAATRFLFQRQQLGTGQFPRNSLINGSAAPDTGGNQLDETAYPILMAWQAGLAGDATLWQDHVRPAADYLVATGPANGSERWEEQSGYSPSTIAAEIAGLTAAAHIATVQGATQRAQLYQATADYFQRSIKGWTVTTTGPDAPRYFIRLSKTGDPNTAISYNLGNGGPTVDQRSVIDGGFQELVRLGELSPTDPDVTASLGVLDTQIGVTTPSGVGYYRYGTSAAAGSADGYGDCYQPSQTSCSVQGAPWPPTGTGTGHLWPVLSGERAETDLAHGNSAGAASLFTAMTQFASGVGLVPEQDWENPDLPASPYGSDPTTASIGFVDGKAAGSASPLTWAQAQELRLILGLGAGHAVESPAITRARYVQHAPPAALSVTLTGPAPGTAVHTAAVDVTGTTAPNAHIVIGADNSIDGPAADVVSTDAGADGSFSASVPVNFGDATLTVTATRGTATGYAQTTVTSDQVTGTTVLDVADPTGDDNGPGTYQYPTSGDFHPGAFDLTRFRVVDNGTTVYLQATLANLDPTFGSPMGAQLLDVFVGAPGASPTSTAAPYLSRNYALADPWSEYVEVQGFAPPVWQDAAGNSLGTAAVFASPTSRTITIVLPEAAFGSPGTGWTFAAVLTGQDGFSSDQARGFASTAQPYQFGVCPSGGTAAICGVGPGTVPKAVDVIAPSGVAQTSELDPTLGPVRIHAVAVA